MVYSQLQFYADLEFHSVFLGMMVIEAASLLVE